jgi:hypothetical protein
MLPLLDVVSKYGFGHVYTKFCACVCVRTESRVHASSAALLSPAESAIRTAATCRRASSQVSQRANWPCVRTTCSTLRKGEHCVLMLSTIPSLAHYAPVVANDKNSVVTCELAFGVIYIVVSNAKGNQLLLRVPRTQMTFGNTFCASSLYYACTMTIISSSSSL